MAMHNSPQRLPRPLGKRICDERLTRKHTQRQLAALAGLSEDAVKSIEQGRRRNPGVFTVLKIVAALGMTLDELLAEPESPND